MTFKECVDFCESRKHLIGTKGKDGMVINYLVPAPARNEENFDRYLKGLYSNNFNPYKALIIAGSVDYYEPFILFDTPYASISLYSWYFRDYPNEKPVAESTLLALNILTIC